MAKRIIAYKGWNLDDILEYIRKNGAQLEQDNYGDFLLYTGLREDDKGNLVEIDEEEK